MAKMPTPPPTNFAEAKKQSREYAGDLLDAVERYQDAIAALDQFAEAVPPPTATLESLALENKHLKELVEELNKRIEPIQRANTILSEKVMYYESILKQEQKI